MKTLEDWNKANVTLDQFLTEPCEIDEDLALYIGEVVAPAYSTHEFIQGGDPVKSEESFYDEDPVMYYDTVSRIGERYFYLGVLPEFRQ